MADIVYIQLRDNKSNCSNYQGPLSTSCNSVIHTLLSRQTPYTEGTNEDHHNEFWYNSQYFTQQM